MFVEDYDITLARRPHPEATGGGTPNSFGTPSPPAKVHEDDDNGWE